MKTLFILAALIFFAATDTYAQNLRAELNLSPHPSMRLSDWSSRREMASLAIYNTSDKSIDVRIDARLSLNGTLIASTKSGQMPMLTIQPGAPAIYYAADIFPENAVSFFGDLKSSTMRTGVLPEGNYELCISLVTITNSPLTSTCRTFSLQKNILPVLLQPEDNKKIISGTEKTTLFVWTPMIPSAPSVNYRIRVVEVLPSQSAQQAFAVNNPLFERTTANTTQLLWPQEIPLPQSGANLAWGIQPEDELGNPLILPERFTNAFTLIILPTKEECDKLLSKIKKLHEDGLKVEEEYWVSEELYQRTTALAEEAEERADAIEIEKYRKKIKAQNTKLEKAKAAFDKVREKYDAAITEYEECGK